MKKLLFLLLLMPALAFAQTQTWQPNVSWTPGPVLPDGTNAPTGFKLERKAGTGGTFSQITQTAANVTTFRDSIANDPGGSTYCYRVRAFNAVGDGPYSGEGCGTSPVVPKLPTAPNNVQVSSISSSEIRLSWRDNSTNEDGFLARREGAGETVVLDIADANVTKVIDAGLQRRTRYCYEISAFNKAGQSSWSRRDCTRTASR